VLKPSQARVAVGLVEEVRVVGRARIVVQELWILEVVLIRVAVLQGKEESRQLQAHPNRMNYFVNERGDC